jgi:hypothetical protein
MPAFCCEDCSALVSAAELKNVESPIGVNPNRECGGNRTVGHGNFLGVGAIAHEHQRRRAAGLDERVNEFNP